MAFDNPSGDSGQNVGNASQGTGNAGGGNANVGNVNNPNLGSGGGQPITLTDDSMVHLPGAKAPVRYGDFYKHFQSRFTRAEQAASQSKQQIAQLTQQLQDYQRRTQAYESQRQAGSQPDPRAELVQSLKQLPYLKGEDAVRMVEHIQNQLGSYDKALQQRDVALGLMYQQLKQLSSQVGEQSGRTAEGDFNRKIAGFVKGVGLGKEAHNLAKELYLAYEPGPELDAAFPGILKQRMSEMQGMFKATEQARLQQARRQPFVPGQGGNGSPSRPLDKTKLSTKDITDMFWTNESDKT